MTDTAKPVKVTGQPLSLYNPQDVMDFGKILKDFIVNNKLSTKIQGRDYAHVDGWKFAGMNFGLVAIVGEPVPMHQPGETMHLFQRVIQKNSQHGIIESLEWYLATQMPEAIELEKTRCKDYRILPVYKYRCSCDIINVATQQKLGSGSAICSSLELIKSGFDEYSIFSMAQTRCIGKGFRNLIGFVMNSAGIESTPAEEMPPEMGGQNKTEKAKWGEDIQNQIDLCTDVPSLVKYFNQLPELHQDINFVNALSKRRKQLEAKK